MLTLDECFNCAVWVQILKLNDAIKLGKFCKSIYFNWGYTLFAFAKYNIKRNK